MGLLDKLWDDVVAGPMPDRGLGRLRRPGGHHHHHQDVDHDGGKNRGQHWVLGYYGHWKSVKCN